MTARWSLQRQPGLLLLVMIALVSTAVGMDSTAGDRRAPLLVEWRGTLLTALCGLIVMGAVRGWNWRELGFRGAPVDGWRFWLVVGAVVSGVLVLLMAGMVLLAKFTTHVPSPLAARPNVIDLRTFLTLVVLAPVLEEILYRGLLCTAAEPVLGRRGAIVCSGLIFALAHLIANKLNLATLTAGFLLSWAFLRSRSLWIPLGFHAAGNLAVVAGHIAVAASQGHPVWDVLRTWRYLPAHL
jgi:membrane protease YdiL (CAAX protease family)